MRHAGIGIVALVLLGCTHPAHVPTPASPPSASTAGLPGQKEEIDPWAGQPLIEPPAVGSPRALPIRGMIRFGLRNGLQVVLIQSRQSPMIDVSLSIRAGALDETMRTKGIAKLTAGMLRQGTKQRSADEVTQIVEQLGGSLSVQADDERTTLRCQVLAKDIQNCLDLVADLAAHPTFPMPEMEEVREQVIAQTEQIRDDKDALADLHFGNQLYGERHPKGLVLTQKDVRALGPSELAAFHARYFVASNAMLAIAGNVKPPHKWALERFFGGWNRGKPNHRKEISLGDPKGLRVLLIDKPDLTQTRIVLGHAGIRHRDRDYYAALLANYTLGGGVFSSRLMERIRAKAGKTYIVHSQFTEGEWRGDFRVAVDVPHNQAVAVLEEIRDELRKMKQLGPTEQEVRDAKAHLAGSYSLRLQTPSELADAIVVNEWHGRGLPDVENFPLRVAGVSAIEIRKAASRLFHPDDLVLVMVGRADAEAAALRSAGFTVERAGYLDPIAATARRSTLAK